MLKGYTHEDHPEWEDHMRMCNQKRYFIPTLKLNGVTVKERHDEETVAFGYFNEYVYERSDGALMQVMNSYGSVGWREGKWEVRIVSPKLQCGEYYEGHLKDEDVETILYRFMREEI